MVGIFNASRVMSGIVGIFIAFMISRNPSPKVEIVIAFRTMQEFKGRNYH